jgi:hypothetical protein
MSAMAGLRHGEPWATRVTAQILSGSGVREGTPHDEGLVQETKNRAGCRGGRRHRRRDRAGSGRPDEVLGQLVVTE